MIVKDVFFLFYSGPEEEDSPCSWPSVQITPKMSKQGVGLRTFVGNRKYWCKNSRYKILYTQLSIVAVLIHPFVADDVSCRSWHVKSVRSAVNPGSIVLGLSGACLTVIIASKWEDTPYACVPMIVGLGIDDPFNSCVRNHKATILYIRSYCSNRKRLAASQMSLWTDGKLATAN
jgi:hypothetical protein